MKLIDIIQINAKKLRRRKSSAMFLILPIALLVSLIIIISSQVTNLRAAAEISIFGTVEEQNTMIELKKDPEQFRQARGFQEKGLSFVTEEDLYYTENDVTKIEAVDNVIGTQMLVPVPISNIVAANLFDVTFSVNRLIALGDKFATLYTDQDFSYFRASEETSSAYKEGESIPIILNANSFVEVYEDWGGKDEITIERGAMKPGEGGAINAFPIKSRAIDYDKNALLGKEITIQFGGLDKIQTYKTEQTSSGMVLSKLTSAEITEKSEERKDAISKCWDYAKIEKPLEYKFKVVGVIESESNNSTFVPEAFVNVLMQSYIKHQLDARTSKAIPEDELGTTFVGLEYDGVELKRSGGGFTVSGMGGRGVFIGKPGPSSGYYIPGLVIEVERESSSEESSEPWQQSSADVIGEYKKADVYESSAENGEVIIVKFASIYDRQQVVNDLNKLGYAYQDLSSAGVFEELKSTLNTVSVASVVAFIGLSIVIIIFTMGKFIAESKREIGIFRAVGATRFDIKKVFIIQALLYAFIGYIVGLLGGIALNFALANPVKAAFDSFIGKTIEESFSVVNPVDAEIFSNINWEALLIYSGLLLLITISTSIVPATNASKMSPVEAIRGE